MYFLACLCLYLVLCLAKRYVLMEQAHSHYNNFYFSLLMIRRIQKDSRDSIHYSPCPQNIVNICMTVLTLRFSNDVNNCLFTVSFLIVAIAHLGSNLAYLFYVIIVSLQISVLLYYYLLCKCRSNISSFLLPDFYILFC